MYFFHDDDRLCRPAATALAYRQTLNRNQPVVLEVSGNLGTSVDVTGTQSQALEVSALAQGSLAASVVLTHWQAADGLHVRLDLSPHQQTLQRWFYMHNTQVQSTMKIPSSVKLTINAVNGAIGVDNVSGPTTVNLVNGAITVRGAGDVLSLKTVNGPIDVEVEDAAHVSDIALNVTNGSIDVRVPRNFKASVDARTVIGAVDNGVGSGAGPGKLEAHVAIGAISIAQQ